jgi:ferredoxin-NADP reductase
MNVTFDHSEPESRYITTLYFKPEYPIRYTAGQFIELTVPHKHPDSRGIKRWFTLSSSPMRELLSITTRYSGKESSSFKKTLFALKPGAMLHMSDPMGDFVLPKLIQTPLIFVAGGIGVTPMHSMLQWLSDAHESRPIKFIYGIRSEEELLFQKTFDDVNQHVTVVVAEPLPAWGGERGQLSAELILGLEKPSDDTLIYISGPEGMVETLFKDLAKEGIKKDHLVGDYFPGYEGV